MERSDRQSSGPAQAHTATAIEQLQVRLVATPNDFDAMSRLGDLYFESGQYISAIQIYDRALKIDPNCADCLNDKGLAQFFIGDPESALASLDQATVVDPSYPNAWLSKGYILVSIGRFQEAIVPLNQVKALDSPRALVEEADSFLALIPKNVMQQYLESN